VLKIHAEIESWPIEGRFVIARGSNTVAEVVVATIHDNGHTGRGECVPYARYGETPQSILAAIRAVTLDTADRDKLAALLPAGAARNALDCALWDLQARKAQRSVPDLCGIEPPRPVITAYTLSLGAPQSMAEAAKRAADRPVLKIKLGGAHDAACLAAVRDSAPDATLIVDANEGWQQRNLHRLLDQCADLGVALVEQPLPAGADAALGSINRPVPLCADESLHNIDDLQAISGRYDAVNIKLDKAGGLTHALELKAQAQRLGLSVMIGCMVATSLAMAPALLLAADAAFVDLDGPLLLARDRKPGLTYRGSRIEPPPPGLWG